jgi:hypothetical protein
VAGTTTLCRRGERLRKQFLDSTTWRGSVTALKSGGALPRGTDSAVARALRFTCYRTALSMPEVGPRRAGAEVAHRHHRIHLCGDLAQPTKLASGGAAVGLTKPGGTLYAVSCVLILNFAEIVRSR